MIRKMELKDIEQVANIASESFSGLSERAEEWIGSNFRAFPRMQYFVSDNNEIDGYILWMEKGGFRDRSVWELEQIAVHKDHRGKGIAKSLIKESLESIKKQLKERCSELKLIEVTTGAECRAQNLYKKALGAEVETIIKDFFRGDEVIMIRRF